jgi:octaprenyl-diphosphate synthase
MLRPQLVIACGFAAAGSAPTFEPRREHLVIGAVCEMIHMATLVHDDVLDEADVRRRGSTVNRLRGNEAAVILGDYLFSSAYRLCSSLPGSAGQHAALLIGQTGMTLCSGELLQLHHRGDFSLDQATYERIVENKTASLIGTACRLGALASGAAASVGECFNTFGIALGKAFQIQDDLLDLTGNQSLVGKPLHRDAELGKLTLPLIHHLASAAPVARGSTLMLLRETSRTGRGQADQLLDALGSTGSIGYARQHAEALVETARAALGGVPDSAGKRVLMHMSQRVVTRSF